MPLAARKDDPVLTGHGCDSTTTLDTPTQNSVYVVGKLWCRKDDYTISHQIDGDNYPPDCDSHTAQIISGSSTVFVVGKPAARHTDPCDSDQIDTPTQNTVYAGG